ncbi:hypothetical protein AAFF_G00243130, partial [Aldrovandia affinis]
VPCSLSSVEYRDMFQLHVTKDCKVIRHPDTGAVIAASPRSAGGGGATRFISTSCSPPPKACAVDSSSRKHLANGTCSASTPTTRTSQTRTSPSYLGTESSMTNSSEVETLAIQPQKLLILDARVLPNCEVVFMGMANIHSIRKSFQSLRFLCTQMPDPAK